MDIQEIIKRDKESRNFTVEVDEVFFKMCRPQQMEFYAYMARCGMRAKEVDGETQIDSSPDADFQFLISVGEFVTGWDNAKEKDLDDSGGDALVTFSKEALALYLDRHPQAYGILSKAMQDNYNAHYNKANEEKKASSNTAVKAPQSKS